MSQELTESQQLFLHNSKLWAKGAIFQGKRLLLTSEQSRHLLNLIFSSRDSEEQGDWRFYQEQHSEISDICRYEDDFFVLALYNTIFYLSKVADTFAEFKIIVDEIEAVNGEGQIKDIRDMRVHINEYIKGKGFAKERFIYESPEDLYPVKKQNVIGTNTFENCEHMFASDATGTIILPDAYLIGGRINVQKTIAVLEKLLPDIIQKSDKYINPWINAEE